MASLLLARVKVDFILDTRSLQTRESKTLEAARHFGLTSTSAPPPMACWLLALLHTPRNKLRKAEAILEELSSRRFPATFLWRNQDTVAAVVSFPLAHRVVTHSTLIGPFVLSISPWASRMRTGGCWVPPKHPLTCKRKLRVQTSTCNLGPGLLKPIQRQAVKVLNEGLSELDPD